MQNTVTVELTPSKYLDRDNQSKRNHLSYDSRQSEVRLEVIHDKSNLYDDKALKVFYDGTFIGYVRKRYIDEDLTDVIDDLCFDSNQLTDINLRCVDSIYYISATKKTVSSDYEDFSQSKFILDTMNMQKKAVSVDHDYSLNTNLVKDNKIDTLAQKMGWILK